MKAMAEFVEKARRAGAHTVDVLFSEFQPEIRARARKLAGSERSSRLLQPTELVQDAYLRLRGIRGHNWRDRNHFLRTVTRTFRRLILDHAKRSRAIRHGGGLRRTTMSGVGMDDRFAPEERIALREALIRLASESDQRRRQATVLELRFYLGLRIAEISERMTISTAQVHRDMHDGLAWLQRELDGRLNGRRG